MKDNSVRWSFIFQYGYTITNIVNAFLLLPIYIATIPKDVLGIWWATGNVLAWLTMVDPGVGDVLQQRIGQSLSKSDWPSINKLKAAGYLCGGIVFVLTAVFGITLFMLLEIILKQDVYALKNFSTAFVLTILSTALSLFSFVLTGMNMGLERSKTVAISYITGNILYLVLNILLLTVWNFGILSIAICNLVRVVWVIGINLFYKSVTHSLEGFSLDLGFTKSFSRIFLHTAASRVFTSAANNVDLILIARYLPPGNVTLFEVNRRPLKMLQGLIGRYSVALMPRFTTMHAADDVVAFRSEVKSHFAKYAIGAALISSGLAIFGNFAITLWAGEGQAIATDSWLLLCATSFFWLIGYFFSNLLFATGDIKYTSLVSMIRSVIYIGAIIVGLSQARLNGLIIGEMVTVMICDLLLLINRAHGTNRIYLKDISPFLLTATAMFAVACLITIFI